MSINPSALCPTRHSHVTGSFVQATRLARIPQVCSGICNAVTHLVASDIKGHLGCKILAVTISIYHAEAHIIPCMPLDHALDRNVNDEPGISRNKFKKTGDCSTVCHCCSIQSVASACCVCLQQQPQAV